MTASRMCVLVLGAHRSGTSALTRVLSLLGVAPPRHRIGADKYNESGYWEPATLNALHNQMLAEAGSRWDDWRAFDPTAFSPERAGHYKREIKRLIAEEYGDASFFVVKDPRICRFVPLYEEILAELGIAACFISITRNPLAVIASLVNRDGMTPGVGGLLWLRHVLDAEAATRGKKRAFLSYENFLDDWRGTIAGVNEALDLDWPNRIEDAAGEIDSHLTRSLQHHAPSVAELLADLSIEAWTRESYAALRRLERRHPKTGAALKQLSRIRAEFEASSAIFGRAMYPELAGRERRAAQAEAHFAELAELQQRLIATQEAKGTAERSALEWQSELASIHERLVLAEQAKSIAEEVAIERLAELAELQQRLTATQEAKGTAERLALERQSELVSLHERLVQTEQAKNSVEGEVHALQVQLAAIQTSKLWRLLEKLGLIRLWTHNQ